MRITQTICNLLLILPMGLTLAFGQEGFDNEAIKISPLVDLRIEPLREGAYRVATAEDPTALTSLKTTAPEIQENVTKVASVVQYNEQRLKTLPVPADIKQQAGRATHISLVISEATKQQNIVRFRLKPTYILNKSGTRRLITPKYAKGELWEIDLDSGELQLVEKLDSWGIIDL